MALTYKVLAQLVGNGAGWETLYQAPAGTQVLVSSLVVRNLTGIMTTIRIRVRMLGDGVGSEKNEIYNGVPILLTPLVVNAPICLAGREFIEVHTATPNSLCFHAYGVEIT